MNIIIDDLSKLNPKPNQWVASDLEIFTKKGDKIHLHRPHTGKFACLSVSDDAENSYVFTDEKMVAPVLDKLRDCMWVMQNGKFDITHLRRWASVPPRKKYYDTMFIERILFNGLYDSFSLKSMARRHLGIELSKEEREGFEGATELTRELIEYSAYDPVITLQVAKAQKKLLDDDDKRIWTDIDLPAMWAFLDFKGFAINVDGWKALAEKNKSKQEEIDAQLPFNPRSPKQVVAYLSKHGFARINNSQEKTLSQLTNKFPETKAARLAQLVLESRMYSKRASTYGTRFIEEYLEYDGDVPVVCASYDISRAETGRCAASDPPMNQIPSRETKEYREQFVARPNNKIIVADYNAQEPRLSAYVSKDQQLAQWFNQHKSIYIELAREVFGKEITKKDKEYSPMKSTVLGLNYGMSEKGLAERENISEKEAAELISKTLSILPELANYMSEQRKEKTKIVTPFGRKVWLNRWSDQVERNALNAPIQGGAADITKKALASIHQKWNFDYPFAAVGFIHDELVFDVPEKIANDVAQFVKKEMEEVATNMVNGYLPFVAEVSIGNTWADK